MHWLPALQANSSNLHSEPVVDKQKTSLMQCINCYQKLHNIFENYIFIIIRFSVTSESLPLGVSSQSRSSESSPQSLSESQSHVLRTHLLLSHWNSLGSQPKGSRKIKKYYYARENECGTGCHLLQVFIL